MSHKKNIDRLFQEKFKDFEVTPNDAVWDRISESLPNKKKKRRVVALWWQIGGVAAAIALLLTVGISMFNSDLETAENPTIVDVENAKDTPNSNNNDSSSNNNKNEITDDNQTETFKYVEAAENNETINKKEDNNDKANNKKASSQLTTPYKSQLNAVANTPDEKEEKVSSQKRNSINKIIRKFNNKDELANNSADKNDEIIDKTEMKSVIENSTKKNESAVADNGAQKTSEDTSNSEITDNGTANDLVKEREDALLKEANKEDIDKAIAAQEEHIDEKEKEDKRNRWSIAPNVAPVYFSSLGQGSSLDSQFNENTKSSDINMSYGITGTYAVSKKLKIRTGVSRVNLSQTTSNVYAFSGGEFAARGTGNGNPVVTNGNIRNKGSNVVLMSGNVMDRNTTPEVLNARAAGDLDQRLGFIEVPLEAEYRLLDKKFGLNFIGGFSTFFLNQNEIYADVDGESTLIGEASNINSTSFSANLGLGIDYKLSKQWNINLEPQFKYQINTFNNTSGDFRPFFVGVYTGLSFKF